MGILSRALTTAPERRGVTLSPDLWRSISKAGTAAGVTVNHSTALTISAVFACVRVLSETLASLPLILYERRPGGDKSRAAAHPLYSVLHSRANAEMTAFTLRETLMQHVVTWGNGYAEIEINGRGDVIGLWPLRPDRTRAERIRGELVYSTEIPGIGPKSLPAERVFHVHGPGFDGLSGYSMIGLFRETMGLAMATEKFGSIFFGNGARPGVVLKHPGHLSEDAQARLRDSWIVEHGGLEKAHRVAILEEGLDVTTIGIPPEEAQFLATRKFQVTEIARIFRMQPHMIGDLERATFSNIEHQGIEFVIHSMRPWLVRWEQEIERQLLTAAEAKRYYAEHLVDGLLRGDTASRYSAYSIGRQGGWLSANDIRRLENMDGLGPEGDVYLIPLNMIPATTAGAGLAGSERAAWPGGGPGPAGELGPAELRAAALGRRRLMFVWERQYQEAAGRMARRETNDLANHAARMAKSGGVASFLADLDRWYDNPEDGFSGVVAGAFRPLAWSYGELIAAEVAAELGGRGLASPERRDLPEGIEPWAQRYVEAFASRWATKSKKRINEVIRVALETGAEWMQALQAELDQWRSARPADVAKEEAVRFNNALAVALYVGAGVGRLRWVAFDKSCPYCTRLDGQIVGISSNFLEAGQAFLPDGADRPLTPGTNIKHAPAHGGCDCMVVAA